MNSSFDILVLDVLLLFMFMFGNNICIASLLHCCIDDDDVDVHLHNSYNNSILSSRVVANANFTNISFKLLNIILS